MMALKDAIVKVYWKQTDMRALLDRSGVPQTLIVAQDWTRYKFHIISPILEQLNNTDSGVGPLRRIVNDALSFKNCDHLLWMTDGKQKKQEAEASLDRLRKLVEEHDKELHAKEEQRKARLERIAELKRGSVFRDKLTDLRQRFLAYCGDSDRRKSGFGLEDILYDLFALFELNPKGSFRRTGEQIDGAFQLERDHFLLEAKWQEKSVILADLRDLDGAVASSLDNTLGLFISINGFSQDALDGYVQGSRPKIICMDGADLMAVLEGLIDLVDLVNRKKDIASQRRIVFAPTNKIMQGTY